VPISQKATHNYIKAENTTTILALGSAGETRNFLAIALMNEYITKDEYDALELRLSEIIKMLHGCIRKLQSESGSELNDASMV